MANEISLTNRQLSLMQAISKSGIPFELMDIFMSRCGTSLDAWLGLLENKLVELNEKENRYFLTALGKKIFKKEKVGRYY